MAWFRVDDGFATSPKVLRIPRSQRLAAVGLWTIAGAWSSQHLTDGEIPTYMLEEWGADVSHGTALVTVGLWVETVDGYCFHDWSDYQPSRVDVRAGRERERARKEAWRAKKAEERGESPANVPGVSRRDGTSLRRSPDPTQPNPSLPDPSISSEGAAKRGQRLPEPFMVTAPMREWAAREVPTVAVDASTRRFVDHWRAESGPKASKKDWVAAWRNWLRRDSEHVRPGSKPSKDDRALTLLEMGRELAGDGPKAVAS